MLKYSKLGIFFFIFNMFMSYLFLSGASFGTTLEMKVYIVISISKLTSATYENTIHKIFNYSLILCFVTSPLAYTKTEVNSSRKAASSCFSQLWINDTSDKCLSILTLLIILIIHINKPSEFQVTLCKIHLK